MAKFSLSMFKSLYFIILWVCDHLSSVCVCVFFYTMLVLTLRDFLEHEARMVHLDYG